MVVALIATLLSIITNLGKLQVPQHSVYRVQVNGDR